MTISSSVNFLSVSLAYFSVGVFIFILLNRPLSLYVKDISPLSAIYTADVFLQWSLTQCPDLIIMEIVIIFLKTILWGGVFIREHFTIFFLYHSGQGCLLLGNKGEGPPARTLESDLLVCSGGTHIWRRNWSAKTVGDGQSHTHGVSSQCFRFFLTEVGWW